MNLRTCTIDRTSRAGVGRIRAALLLAGCFALPGFLRGTAAAQEQSPSHATAEHTFKNIQVLKDIPPGQLIPAMQFITASLGVECGFCHVENHFDQDDKKPKLVARKMMLMMQAINEHNFDGHRQVTCNTCHRGSRIPAAIPEISNEPFAPKSEPEEAAANLPDATQLISKYITALGGEKAVAGTSSLAEKGTANFVGRELAIDIYDKAPDKRASVMHFPSGDGVTVFNGQEGWTGSTGRPTREIPASEIEAAKIDADLQFPLHVRETFPNLKAARPETINGHEAYQIVSEDDGQPRIRLYFDEQTGLLLRMIHYNDSPLGLNPVRVDYGDYRPLQGGLQVPYRWTTARPSGQFTIQLTEVKQNVNIDDATFAKPVSPQHAESGD